MIDNLLTNLQAVKLLLTVDLKSERKMGVVTMQNLTAICFLPRSLDYQIALPSFKIL